MRPSGDVLALRNGSLIIVDDRERERERRRVPAGSVLRVVEGDEIQRGDPLFTWETAHVPILTKVDGQVHFEDVRPGVTLEEVIDLPRQIIDDGQKAKEKLEALNHAGLQEKSAGSAAS